ncbi:MAG: hypothetical protein Ct9H300mP25_10940 [Acidobacteriota bacterium]|nr:MAG: hypothetical protein Ct9H300mP25_10940 [Acidobacteriota bacterium]
MNQKDDNILDEADGRWLKMVESGPDLASAVELQRILVTRSIELSGDLSLIEPGITAIPEESSKDLNGSRPQSLNLQSNSILTVSCHT